MSPLKRILRIAKPHRKYLFSSIFFQPFIFIFSDISIIVMLPVLQMIFNVKTEKIEKPQLLWKLY